MSRISRLIMVAVLAFMVLAGTTAPTFAAQAGAGNASTPTGVQSEVGFHWWGHITTVAAGTANVRYCPSMSCGIVYHVHYGIRVHEYFHYGGWTNIGPNRWIASYLLN